MSKITEDVGDALEKGICLCCIHALFRLAKIERVEK